MLASNCQGDQDLQTSSRHEQGLDVTLHGSVQADTVQQGRDQAHDTAAQQSEHAQLLQDQVSSSDGAVAGLDTQTSLQRGQAVAQEQAQPLHMTRVFAWQEKVYSRAELVAAQVWLRAEQDHDSPQHVLSKH
jgi:hypothetical protein